MSTAASPGSAGLPAVNHALEPAWVRNGSASTQRAYVAALSFEQTLVEQLARSLTATSGLGGESSQEGESASEGGVEASRLSSLLPQALASGVMNAGGLGLAAQLTKGLQGAQATAQTPAGGVSGSGAGAIDTSAGTRNGTSAGTGNGTSAGTGNGTSAGTGNGTDTHATAPAAAGTTGGTNAADTGGTAA